MKVSRCHKRRLNGHGIDVGRDVGLRHECFVELYRDFNMVSSIRLRQPLAAVSPGVAALHKVDAAPGRLVRRENDFFGNACAGNAGEGDQLWARGSDDPLDPLDPLPHPGNRWHERYWGKGASCGLVDLLAPLAPLPGSAHPGTVPLTP